MKRIYVIILTMLVGAGLLWSQTSLTPQQVLQKASTLITATKGVEAKFSINGGGLNGSGEIKSAGGKFKVTFPQIGVWYNGKDLYTYNKKTSETTVVKPTSTELSESNPLNYVAGAVNAYNVKFSTIKKAGKTILELTPKKKSEIKRITLTLRNSDYAPEKIVVEPSSGAPVTAEISSLKTGVSLAASEFEYPKSQYPKVEIIDLR